MVATRVKAYSREDFTQATPPLKTSRIVLSQSATGTNADGQHECLIVRHDIRIVRVVITLPKAIARTVHARPDVMQCEGAQQAKVAPMTFSSRNFG